MQAGPTLRVGGDGRVRNEPGHPAGPPSSGRRARQASGSRSPTRHLASCRATSRCSSGPGTGPEALISRQTAKPAARASYSDDPLLGGRPRRVVGEGPPHRERPLVDPERLGREPRAVAVVGRAELDVERVGAELGEQRARPVRRGRRRCPGDEDPQPGGRAVHPDTELGVAPGELPHGFTGQALGDARVTRSGRGEAASASSASGSSAGVIGVGAGSPERSRRKKPPTPSPRRAPRPVAIADPSPEPGRRAVTSSSSGTSTSAMKSRSVHSTSHPIRLRVTTPSRAPDPASTSSSTGSRSGIRG